MFHMHLLIKQQRNQAFAFVVNSCPFSGYAGIIFLFS